MQKDLVEKIQASMDPRWLFQAQEREINELLSQDENKFVKKAVVGAVVVAILIILAEITCLTDFINAANSEGHTFLPTFLGAILLLIVLPQLAVFFSAPIFLVSCSRNQPNLEKTVFPKAAHILCNEVSGGVEVLLVSHAYNIKFPSAEKNSRHVLERKFFSTEDVPESYNLVLEWKEAIEECSEACRQNTLEGVALQNQIRAEKKQKRKEKLQSLLHPFSEQKSLERAEKRISRLEKDRKAKEVLELQRRIDTI